MALAIPVLTDEGAEDKKKDLRKNIELMLGGTEQSFNTTLESSVDSKNDSFF